MLRLSRPLLRSRVLSSASFGRRDCYPTPQSQFFSFTRTSYNRIDSESEGKEGEALNRFMREGFLSSTPDPTFHIHQFRSFFDENGALTTSKEEVTRWLQQRKIDPAYAFKWLTHHYKVTQRMEATYNVIRMMPQFGISPDATTLSLMIQGHLSSGDLPAALTVYETLTDRNLKIESAVASSLIRLCLEEEQLAEAVRVVVDLGKSGHAPPDAILMRRLVEKLINQRNYSAIQQIITHFGDPQWLHVLRLDESIMHTATQHPQRAFLLAEKLLETSYMPSESTATEIIRSFIRNRDIHSALRMCKLLEERQIELSATQLNILLSGAVLTGNMELARKFFDAFRATEVDLPFTDHSSPAHATSVMTMLGGYMDAGDVLSTVKLLREVQLGNQLLPGVFQEIFEWCLSMNHVALAAHMIEEFPMAEELMPKDLPLALSSQLFRVLIESGNVDLAHFLCERMSLRSRFHSQTIEQCKSFISSLEVDPNTKAATLHPLSDNHAISQFISSGNMKQVRRVVQGMRESGSLMDSTTVELYLSALIQDGDFEGTKAFIAQTNVDSYEQPHPTSITDLVKLSLSQFPVEDTFSLLLALREGYKWRAPMEVTSSLFQAALGEKKFTLAQKIIEGTLEAAEELTPLYGDIIKALVNNNDMKHAVALLHNYLDLCSEDRLPVEAHVPARVIIGFIAQGDAQRALEIMEDSKSKCVPHSTVFPALVSHYMKSQQFAELESLLGQLQEFQVTPDRSIVSAVMENITSDTPTSFLTTLYSRLVAAGMYPSPPIIRQMLTTFASLGHFDLIYSFFDRRGTLEVSLEQSVYGNILADTFKRKDVNRAISVIEMQRRSGINITPEQFSNLLNLAFCQMESGEAFALYIKYKTPRNVKGILNSSNNKVLLQHLLKSRPEEVWKLATQRQNTVILDSVLDRFTDYMVQHQTGASLQLLAPEMQKQIMKNLMDRWSSLSMTRLESFFNSLFDRISITRRLRLVHMAMDKSKSQDKRDANNLVSMFLRKCILRPPNKVISKKDLQALQREKLLEHCLLAVVSSQGKESDIQPNLQAVLDFWERTASSPSSEQMWMELLCLCDVHVFRILQKFLERTDPILLQKLKQTANRESLGAPPRAGSPQENSWKRSKLLWDRFSGSRTQSQTPRPLLLDTLMTGEQEISAESTTPRKDDNNLYEWVFEALEKK